MMNMYERRLRKRGYDKYDCELIGEFARELTDYARLLQEEEARQDLLLEMEMMGEEE